MNNLKNYSDASIDDMVFENRNQSYGAYELRRSSDKHLKIALFIGILSTSVFTAFSLNNKKMEAIDEPTIIVTTVSDLPDIPELPKIEPPQPIVQEVIQQASVAFTEMIVREDLEVTEEVIAIEDLKGKVISNKTVEGPIVEVPIIKEPIVTEPVVTRQEPITIAEQMPEYNGGFVSMQRDIQKQIRYPSQAMRIGTEGTVYVSFVVNTDGSVSDIGLVRGIGDGCDEEAMEAVAKMQKWNPGKQNGKTVRVKITVPIKFELAND